jgi:hypothetical protein
MRVLGVEVLLGMKKRDHGVLCLSMPRCLWAWMLNLRSGQIVQALWSLVLLWLFQFFLFQDELSNPLERIEDKGGLSALNNLW